MWTIPLSLHQSLHAFGPLDFLRDSGPILLISIGAALGPVFSYFFLLQPYLEYRQKRSWLALHRQALRKNLILQFLLASLEAKLPPCTNCGRLAPQFWDHGRNLLVFRCPHCELNKTLTAFQFPEVLLVLEHLSGLYILLNRLRVNSSDRLGHHLRENSPYTELFIQKRLKRN